MFIIFKKIKNIKYFLYKIQKELSRGKIQNLMKSIDLVNLKKNVKENNEVCQNNL